MVVKRLFTAGMASPYDSSRFVARSVETAEGGALALEVPEDWSLEAAGAFSAALFQNRPAARHTVEENTIPSWLWRRRPAGPDLAPETSARQVFDRLAGAAAHAGWKKGLWREEAEARAFYDEVCFALAHRLIALDPERMAAAGVDWAYGAPQTPSSLPLPLPFAELESMPAGSQTGPVSVRNETIDHILSGGNALARTRWQKLLRGGKAESLLALRFADTAGEWGQIHDTQASPRLMLNLARFLRDDGTVDVSALRQATRLAALLLELHYESWPGQPDPSRPLAIGYANLGALLLALALPYDSKEGRATAAALSAVITAEAVHVSALLAEQLGACPEYSVRREASLRALRNHRRAAYGERNDFERISILPVPLTVEDGADLVLVAAARRGWDEALDLAQRHGLRHLQLTALFEAPSFAAFLECSAQGLEPETHLVRQFSALTEGFESFRRTIHPAVPVALEKAGCAPGDIEGMIRHAVGTGKLKDAPGVNHKRLRELGFDTEALARVEGYLPSVNDIRTVFTPWILGEYFCRYILRISPRNLCDPRFDVLRHLGFSAADIAAANAHCCGHGTVLGAKGLTARAQKLFAAENASAEARIRMAAAVQGFIMGDVNLVFSLPSQTGNEARANLLLSGWRQGLKSMSLYFEGFAMPVQPGLRTAASKMHRKIIGREHTMPAPTMPRAGTAAKMTSPRGASSTKPKATSRAASLRRQGTRGSGAGVKRG